MRALNMSVVLSRRTLTTEALSQAIQLFVDRHQRLSIVKHLERLHQLSESEGGGARRAAQLIDGWLRNGYAHLDTLDHYLPFWVAYKWDTYVVTLLVVYTTWRIILWYFRSDRKISEKKKTL